MTRITRILCILLFAIATLGKVHSQGLFNALFVDINDKGSFPSLNDLTICG
jgi:hypothetical protein